MKVEDGAITAANGSKVTYWQLVTGRSWNERQQAPLVYGQRRSIDTSASRTHASTSPPRSPARDLSYKT